MEAAHAPIKLTVFRKGLILLAVPVLFPLAHIGVVAEMQLYAVEADGSAELPQADFVML